MEGKKRLPRVVLTAAASGIGKTTLTCGILAALQRRGLHPASFKCGPDYIDPLFHREILGRASTNLDPFLCGESQIERILARVGADADLAVVEGVMGYYDGLGGISTEASTFHVAKCTKSPVILIQDCKGISVSAAALIQGMLHYQPDSRIRGVILNRISPGMYPRMKELIESQLPVRVLGYLPVQQDGMLESRYLGLRLPHEKDGIREQLERLGRQVEETVDLDGILALAGEAPELSPPEEAQTPEGEPVRIGVARDEAFCFIYPENLRILEALGGEPVFFSPLRDEHLPEDLDGLIFYGGYPELYAEALSENTSLRQEIRKAIEEGTPCIAECGGFMYLQERLETADGKSWSMVGALKGGSASAGALRRFGYVTLSGGKVFGKEAGELNAHEFHYYDSEICGEAFTARKPLSKRSWKCMVSTETLFAGYPHFHYGGVPRIAEYYLEACRKRRETVREKHE